MREYAAAEECYHRALILAPNSHETLLNLGYVLGEQGRTEEALSCYESVLAVCPENAKARYNRAAHLLRKGDLAAGFADYEARFAAIEGTDSRIYSQPRWDGSPLEGRSILVYCEQGLGDAIMFARYLPMLADMRGRVVLELQQPLIRLLSSLRGVDRVVEKSDVPPSTDVYIPLLSLPHIFRTTINTIPSQVPYIHLPENTVDIWREKIGDRGGDYRIGLIWAGKERPYPNRSCPPAYLAPLLAVPGTRFFSLQVGERDRFPLPDEFMRQVTDLTAGIGDMADTAAMIADLDMVITIDTAVAHLAGALGKTVLVMLPFLSDWRWMLNRDDSPWYPTMRLFRQPRPGDWASVVDEIIRALHELPRKHSHGTKLSEESEESHFQAALKLIEDGASDAAITRLNDLLLHATDDPAIWFNLGRAYDMAGQPAESARCFRQALLQSPDSPAIWFCLGGMHLKQKAYAEAEACLNKAHELAPESIEILLDLGAALVKQDKTAEAFECCGKMLAIRPDCVEARYNLAYLQLRCGDYLSGFANFEARLAMEKFKIDSRSYPQPRWDGSPLFGKSILVFGEQGMGDVIQFSRYLPMVAERGGKIILEVDKPLIPLFASFQGVAQVVSKSDTPPLTDIHIHLLSLPYLFGTSIETVPNRIPYLFPDAGKVAYWKQILPSDPVCRIGLVWRGNPRNPLDHERSCPLTTFSSLADLPGVRFYSLQVGAGKDEIASLDSGFEVTDYTDGLQDFSDTAAFIANLDLVIGVDTAVTHLAGAMGKSVWVILPHVYDWRWIVGRHDSPWYPTVRVFWQESHHDWTGVITRIKSALAHWLGEKHNNPAHFAIESCYDLGVQLKEEGDLAGAESCFRRIVDHAPDLPDPQHSLGAVLQLQGRLREAIEHYRAAANLDPGFVKAHFNLATALWRSGAYSEAMTALQSTLSCDPVHREAHWLYGMLLLLSGDFPNGWREYEWRWGAKAGPATPPNLGCPEWDGSPLAGRTLLIHMEQGRGDMLQFIRYAPMAAARGGRIVVAALTELVSLLASVEGINQVVDRNEPLPAFDFHIPVMSLPRVMGTTLETVPDSTPYLHPTPDSLASWADKLADGQYALRVGLVWSGNEQPDPGRSCPLEHLAPLFEIPYTKFYSVQVGNRDRFPVTQEFADKLIDHTADIRDFSDTAALIVHLDLIISIDTAVAHLAGALGKTVWTLLPFVPDWRWLLDRDDSPWYPTMRLFRQTEPGDWNDVTERVRSDLAALSGNSAFHNRQGISLLQQGHPAKAEQAFSIAVRLDPDNSEAYSNRGVALDALHRHNEAIECYRTALLHKKDSLQANFNIGNSFRSLGNKEGARACYARVVELMPGFLQAHLCLGDIDKERREFESARAHFERALSIDASCADALQGIAEIYQAEEKFEEAIIAFRNVLAIEPKRTSSWNMLGTAYHCIQRLHEAEYCYREALALEPDRSTILNNLGTILNSRGNTQEAVSVFRHLLKLDPEYAEAHWNLSLALLGLGEYEEGWREYEWRFRKVNPVPERGYHQPRWDGGSLNGMTILLHCEQGFGDTIQFARYAPLVARCGGKVVIECQVPALKRLLQSTADVTEVIVTGDPLPHFDCHLPMLSLPLVFDTTLEAIPNMVPYLVAEHADIEIWRSRMGHSGAFRVGIVWHGRQSQVLNRKRSCPLKIFALLAEVPDVEFYSLQIGEGSEQLKEPGPGFAVKDLTAHIRDFADTAAFMANLDLVLTIDTAVAHLAGSIGARTWVLLPYGADWRWLQNRDDSPWYPTMRLFRQTEVGNWQSVIADVGEALRECAPGRLADIETPAAPVSAAKVNKSEHGVRIDTVSPKTSETGLRVGLAWSGRLDNPLNRKRSCPFSALAPLFDVPNVNFVSLQMGLNDKDLEYRLYLTDLTGAIGDFEDTAALMANLDLVITIDTSIAHLAGSLGLPTWVLLSHAADWRWLTDREDSPWYPGMRLFRQHDFGDWDSIIRDVAVRLNQLTADQVKLKPENETSRRESSGNCHERLLLEKVLKRHQQALALNSSDPDAHLDVGASLAMLGRHNEAETFFRKVLQLDPEHVTGHLNLAYSLLARGEYDEGWRHFEWRLQRIPSEQIPPWPMLRCHELGTHRRGTSLLVHCEQGYGDTIQFARFLPLLADAGYRVIVSCQPPLGRLVSSLSGVSLVVPHGEPLPVCELQVLLLSLPNLFHTTLENLPANTPYFVTRPQRIDEWRKRLDGVLPIG